MSLERKIKLEAERDHEFADWMARKVGGEKLRHCLQCGLCSGTCPLSLYMDYTPRRLMYLAREGFKAEVLGSLSIWLCTSCYACAMGCPKQINTTEMMYALKRRAIEEKYYPKHFSVPVMAKQFARMVRQSGRITESWLMMRVLMRSSISSLFGMSRLGLRLFRSRRIGFLPEKIHRRGEIARMMDAVEAARKEFSV